MWCKISTLTRVELTLVTEVQTHMSSVTVILLHWPYVHWLCVKWKLTVQINSVHFTVYKEKTVNMSDISVVLSYDWGMTS